MRSVKTNNLVSGICSMCEQIQTGTKLVAELGIHKKDLPISKEYIKRERCKFLMQDRLHNRITIWIYKYNFVAYLIKEIYIEKETEKPSISDIWISGKLFGYSDFEIGKFLQKHKYIDDPF